MESEVEGDVECCGAGGVDAEGGRGSAVEVVFCGVEVWAGRRWEGVSKRRFENEKKTNAWF